MELGYSCTTVYVIVGIVATTVVISRLSNYHKLDRIPTFGSSSWLGSWWSARRFESDAHLLIEEGYRKYKGLPFKVADTGHWVVIVTSRQHIEELRMAPDAVLSFRDAVNSAMKLEDILGQESSHNSYNVDIIRGRLTRNLSNLYPEMRDEISVAFDEILGLTDTEWKTVSALSAVQKVMCRVSNRVFVGLPLCRDSEWVDLNVRYTLHVVEAGIKIRHFGILPAPVVLHFMTDIPTRKERAMTQLAPIIEERLKLPKEYGSDWDGRPSDMLSWFLEEAPEEPERAIKLLTNRVLTINFSAIHTSSNSFAHALFFLAENPQYTQPLREEVEAIVQKEGWSKASVSQMRKIDSFMKESQRIVGIGLWALARVAVKDFTFSDGTFIPKGTFVAAPSKSIHLDDDIYENAHAFNPFRFSDMRDEDGEGARHHFVTTSPEYLPFGHGKHACPGRFFAADALKSMLAHVVVTYDVKLEDDKSQPEEMRSGSALFADPLSKIMFRKRAYR